MRSSRKGSLNYFILQTLEKAVDGYVRFEDMIYNPGLYAYGSGRPLKKSELSRAFKSLRENNLIELIDESQLIFKLTDFGIDQALWAKMKSDEGSWDGKWRLVLWDIPEKRRKARDVLRFKLKQLGFERWQKSIWASKKDCTIILRKFIRDVGIESWVMVIESENVGNITRIGS